MAEQVQAPSAPLPQESDRAFFLGAPPPEELQKQAQQKAAPPAEAPRVTVPDPTPPAPKVSAHMLALAESMGLSAYEAGSFESDAELIRALAIASRYRQQQSQQSQQPVTPQQDDDDIPDLDERYDPGLVKLAKATKAQLAKLAKSMEDRIPELVHKSYSTMTAAEKVTQLIGDAMQESGYDRAALDQGARQRIVQMGHALYQSMAQSGQKVDEKTIIRTVLPLALGQPSGWAPSAPAPNPTNPTIEAQRAAIASQRERDERGRFAPGSPTHRVSESNGTASALRSALLDAGIDPKEPPAPNDRDFFLK